MMWAAQSIAGFALRVGFPRPALAQAVAEALGASAGDDHAEAGGAVPGAERLQGLWLVPAALVDPVVAVRLFEPLANAQAAYGLWKGAGGSWEWSPAHRAGRWRLEAERGAQAAHSPIHGMPASSVGPAVDLGAAVGRLAQTVRELIGMTQGMAAGRLPGQ